MLGSFPNYFWLFCFLIAPVVTFVIIIFSIIANNEVTLNEYKYPNWAHIIGWVIAAVMLIPIPVLFGVELRKKIKNSEFSNQQGALKKLYFVSSVGSIF